MATWTDEENAIIIQLYTACGARGLSRTALRGRTEVAITSQAMLLRMRGEMPPGASGQPEGFRSNNSPPECDGDVPARIAMARRFKRATAERGKPEIPLPDSALIEESESVTLRYPCQQSEPQRDRYPAAESEP